MNRYAKILLVMSLILLLGYAFWPYIEAHRGEVKALLIQLKKYCLGNPWTGYTLYGAILGTILLAGLPIATAAMLLAGVIYGFWEAATLVTVARLAAALIVFFIVRHLWGEDRTTRRARMRKPYLIRKFENHPNVGLLIARIAPIPDSMVNYTLAASPINGRDYIFISLLGMIPFTLLCVWIGQQLGTVTGLLRYLS